MIDVEQIAAELEAEAQAAGFPRNHRVIEFLTAQGNSAMATVTVNVADPGITENNDTFSLAFSAAATVETLQVLNNDVDNATGNNSNLIVISVTQPPAGQGSVAISADAKAVLWSRPANFFGQAQFAYTAGRA